MTIDTLTCLRHVHTDTTHGGDRLHGQRGTGGPGI
jgi:hypothetical protein